MFKLTGECKEDFEKWLVRDGGKEIFERYYDDNDDIYGIYEWFCKHHKSMQYGVYVDFFDSVGVIISIGFYKGGGNIKPYYQWDIEDIFSKDIKTRQEARAEAIKTANEIYNKAKH